MKVYKKREIIDENELRKGTLSYPFEIVSAHAFPPTMERESLLIMNLKNLSQKELSFNYTLYGKDHRNEFLKDMKCEYPHDLLDKVLTGYIHPNKIGLRGLGVDVEKEGK